MKGNILESGENMSLSIKKLTVNDWKEAQFLQVKKEQENFIESIEECFKESESSDEWHSLGVYVKDCFVGYAMYGWIQEEQRLWLNRFFIDGRYQGNGYGKKGCQLVIEKLWKDFPKAEKIYLSVYKENLPAITLYQFLGFVLTAEKDINEEKIMCLSKVSKL